MLYLLSTCCVLTLAYYTLFPLGDTLLLLSSCRREGVHPELPRVRGLLGIRLPVDVPVAPCSASESFYRILYFASAVSDIFVIYVINNIRIRFIISFTWYVLWYTVYSDVYTCDLILARIWLLGLCPFINRVLHAQLQREFRTCSTLPLICIRHFVINVINNIRIRFIMSFYVICAVIYCSFCCIYVWLDPGTYMITRFMSFCKPGVTRCNRWYCVFLHLTLAALSGWTGAQAPV